MKKALLFIIASVWQLQTYLVAQPLPSDKGPGNPGGNLGPPLGAPIDDFVWGLIVFSALYGIYKWYQIKNKTKIVSD